MRHARTAALALLVATAAYAAPEIVGTSGRHILQDGSTTLWWDADADRSNDGAGEQLIPATGGGGGEANTASNLGGGLANFDSKSGVDLRFNSFAAADFNLATNVISIDTATWATDAEVTASYQPLDSDLTAIAGLAGVQGDIIYRNATQWTRLAAGTSGRFLRTNGAGADPSWADEVGDITDVGDCAGPAAFTTAGCGTLLRTNSDFSIHLDEDNDGANLFEVLDGTNSRVFYANELGQAGARSSDPWLTLEDTTNNDGDIDALIQAIDSASNHSDLFFYWERTGTLQNVLALNGNNQTIDIGLSNFVSTINYASVFHSFLPIAGTGPIVGFRDYGELRLFEDGDFNYIGFRSATRTSDLTLDWNITAATCTGDANGGTLTIVGTEIVCAADDGGGGGGGAGYPEIVAAHMAGF